MSEEADNRSNQSRQVAHKISIAEINECRYVKTEGWEPNYLLTPSDKRVSRVNLMGIVVEQEDLPESTKGFVLDDGTSSISVRMFDSIRGFENLSVGSLVNVIGRPRVFGNEKYILPEILKDIKSPKWLELRRLELGQFQNSTYNLGTGSDPKKSPGDADPSFENEEIGEEGLSRGGHDEEEVNSIYALIKSLDRGDGVDFEQIIEKSKIRKAESILNYLLEQGEIFELRPGRVKVLE